MARPSDRTQMHTAFFCEAKRRSPRHRIARHQQCGQHQIPSACVRASSGAAFAAGGDEERPFPPPAWALRTPYDKEIAGMALPAMLAGYMEPLQSAVNAGEGGGHCLVAPIRAVTPRTHMHMANGTLPHPKTPCLACSSGGGGLATALEPH